MRDMLLVVAGLAGIYAELLRPGKVVPGVAGGVLLMVGVAGLLQGPRDWNAIALLGVPALAVSTVLAAIAWRARRNKRIVN